MDISGFILWILTAATISWFTYRYFISSENTWKKSGIKVVPIWDTLLGFVRLLIYPIHILVEQNYKKYGKLYGTSLFGKMTLLVGEPDLIRQILVKDFQYFSDRVHVEIGDPIIDNMITIAKGEHWKRLRNIMTPTFSTGKIKKMTSVILDCAETLRKNFEKDSITNTPSDIKKYINAFTMDTIASTAFSTKVDSQNDPNNPFVVAATRIFSRGEQFKTFLNVYINRVLKFFRLKPTEMFFSSFFKQIAIDIIKERSKTGQVRNDFLQLMLDAAKKSKSKSENVTAKHIEENSYENSKREEKEEKNLKSEHEGLSEEEILSQCVVFFLAGFETVASTIAFASYELALNETIQENLIAEIDETLRLNQKELTYENVQNMKYMDNVISETLRKYSPAVILQRLALKNYEVENIPNFTIPKGTTVIIPIYALHFDPDYFPNPEVFDPNRFKPEEKATRNPYVYLPFGAGPRNCIAMRFALIEAKLCLAHLLRHFRFRKCDKTQEPLKFEIGQTQLMAKNIFLLAEKREDAVT